MPDKTLSTSPASGQKAKSRRDDLIVEHWQAPDPRQMRDGREIWEYTYDKSKPGSDLWLVLIISSVLGLGGLGFVLYMIFRFFHQ